MTERTTTKHLITELASPPSLNGWAATGRYAEGLSTERVVALSWKKVNWLRAGSLGAVYATISSASLWVSQMSYVPSFLRT